MGNNRTFCFKEDTMYVCNTEGDDLIENEKLMIHKRKGRTAATTSLSRQKGWDPIYRRAGLSSEKRQNIQTQINVGGCLR